VFVRRFLSLNIHWFG